MSEPFTESPPSNDTEALGPTDEYLPKIIPSPSNVLLESIWKTLLQIRPAPPILRIRLLALSCVRVLDARR